MKANNTPEVIESIELSKLHPFPDHPFAVRDDDTMQQTVESIKQYGVLVPAIARPREDGGYELIAGHRRQYHDYHWTLYYCCFNLFSDYLSYI